MATYPLVGLGDDLASLVKTSLRHHNVPVSAVFDVLEPAYENRFVAVATPVVDTEGMRGAYIKVFTALEDETFAAKGFLRLHTLVLSPEEYKEIRRVLKKGMTEAEVSRIVHLDNVIVRPVDDAKDIQKSGFLHIIPSKSGSCLLTFGSFGTAAGAMKPHLISDNDALKSALLDLNVRGVQAEEIVSDLKKTRTSSIPISCSLENLYRLGLV
jgi:hypothetical protein